MSVKPDMKLIISNITNGKRFSHCRLCLKNIEEDYVRFGDGVALDLEEKHQHLQPLSELLAKFLGPEVTEEIPGLDAVCTECVVDALRGLRLIQTYHKSSRLLEDALDNLLHVLNVDLKVYDDQSLYIIVDENHSELIVMNKNNSETKYNVGETKIICDECSGEFTTTAEYHKHCEENHNQLLCEKCWQAFETNEELINHLCKKLKCPDCNQYRNTAETLMEHHNKIHKIHICKECGKSCQGSVKLKIHEGKHFNKSQCPKCGKSYATRDFYLKHVDLCEKGLLDPHPFRTKLHKPYSCKECGKSYSTSGGLRVHYKFEHGGAKPHVCPECNKKFTAPSYLKVHMVTHTKEKNFLCNICPNRFVSKEALLYHTRRHTGERPYKCEHCFETFVNASARAEHIKYKHVGPTLMCEICSRKFVTPHFLRTHIKRHHEKDSDWCTENRV
ncbi:zinc finger protein 226-like [Cydia fagiglandana]|uniref:zinc finger protein 226-like n=1 Tax=Cydia fagiglandana TaxID=1458189 RepID=UPI002FEE0014